MSRDILNVDTSFATTFDPLRLNLQDYEALRLILQGHSVIDWHKLDMPTHERVDEFLKLHLLDMGVPGDRERLRFVFNQAVNYLEEHHDVRFPSELRDPADMRDIFVAASAWSGKFRRRQTLACMILKLMHTINHMDAADLKYRAPLSEAELLDRAEKVIMEYADGMRSQGYPLLAFYGSRKSRTSIITKLLAKREALAATVFDKLRFRIVVQTPDEILPVISHLTRTLFPFNYVIPGESHNNLLNLRRLQKEVPHLSKLSDGLQKLRSRPSEWIANTNPFSGNTYRMVNFIVDFPVRVDDLVDAYDPNLKYMLGSTVYVLVEFQLVDVTTSDANESGENAHHIYKERQMKTVEGRLLKGALSKVK